MDDFDSVSWQNESEREVPKTSSLPHQEGESDTSRPPANGKRRLSSTPQQAGRHADAVDLGGIGDGTLECTVDTPMKESEGTKDAYVSYLVTTHVSR